MWEASPPEELVPIVEERLRRQLGWVLERSPFYREKLAGVEPEGFTLERLAELPFTVKDEVRRTQEEHGPFGGHACVGWDEVARVHASSGTTGQPTLVGATRRDLDGWNEIMARCLWAQGVRPSSRAWVPVPLGWWIAGLSFVDALQHLGAAVLPSGNTEAARTFRVLARTGADYANGTPSLMRHLASVARDELGLDPRSLGLSSIGVGGEPGAGLPHVRSQLEEEWGATVYDNMGTADFCTLLWSECEAQDGMHFMAGGYVHPELVDLETLEPLAIEEGATGELVYTALNRQCTPLLRFRIGDIARIVGTGTCSCGRTSFRILCVGRSDDMLICQGVNVYPSAVADVVAAFRPRTTGQLAIEVAGAGPSVAPPVSILVEANENGGLKAELEARIRSELVFRADVRLVEPGSLARPGVKTALVRRV
jgi:phenylacetate-CoA ligase